MSTKPNEFIGWLENSPPAGAIATPSQGQKDTGWVVLQKPPFQYFNWFFNLVGRWIKYFDDENIINEAAILANTTLLSSHTTELAVHDAALVTHQAFITAYQPGVASKSPAAVANTGTTTLTQATHDGAVLEIDSAAIYAGGNPAVFIAVPLVASATRMKFTVIDKTGVLSSCTVAVKAVSGNLPMLGSAVASYALLSDYGAWTFYCDGTNWYLI